MIDSLRGAVEADNGHFGGCRPVGRSGTEPQTAHRLPARGEIGGVDNLLHSVGIPLFGHQGAGAELFGSDSGDARQSVVFAAHCNESVGPGKLEQRRAARGRRHSRGYGHSVELLLGELCLDVEFTYTVDVVAEEIYAVRLLVAVAEDVDDRAAHGELTGLVDVVDFGEAVVAQAVDNFAEVVAFADGEAECVAVESVARGNALGQSLGTGDQSTQSAGLPPCVEGLGAENAGGLVGAAVFYIALISRREHSHGVFAQQARQVVIEIAGVVGIVADNNHRARFPVRQQSGNHHRRSRTAETAGIDDVGAFHSGAEGTAPRRSHEDTDEVSQSIAHFFTGFRMRS